MLVEEAKSGGMRKKLLMFLGNSALRCQLLEQRSFGKSTRVSSKGQCEVVLPAAIVDDDLSSARCSHFSVPLLDRAI